MHYIFSSYWRLSIEISCSFMFVLGTIFMVSGLINGVSHFHASADGNEFSVNELRDFSLNTSYTIFGFDLLLLQLILYIFWFQLNCVSDTNVM